MIKMELLNPYSIPVLSIYSIIWLELIILRYYFFKI